MPRPTRRSALSFFLAASLLSSAALAQQYWTPSGVLKSFFASSKRVSFKRVSLSDADAKAIAKKLGVSSVATDWDVYVATSGDTSEGFAVLDSEKGMHEPIDFAVKFSTSGAVERVEIREYREAYGDEVRSDRFRAQFVGKSAKDPITIKKDIDIVSGASISSNSIAVGVKRDALIVDAALKSGALP